MSTQKGLYKPKFPQKYKGNPCNIVFRSSWEYKLMKYFDLSSNIVEWQSEELWIPYRSPVDRKVHRYFPDFIVKLQQKDGSIKTFILEVKPAAQTKQPKQRKQTKRFITESITYAINQEKWRAADLFCKEHGWQFKIITEKELGI